MIAAPMDVLRQYPVRKTKKQKAAFRADAISYLQSLGYPVRVESGSFGTQNIIAGDPEKAQFLVTAHYDTCAVLPFPNFAAPCSFWVTMAYQLAVAVFMLALMFGLDLLLVLLKVPAYPAFLISYLFLLGFLYMMLRGPANRSNANDNTSGVVSVLTLASQLPRELRETTCFVLFDLEEAGLIGSGSYRKQHKLQTDRQLVVNLDCIGDGDQLWMFPTKGCRKDPAAMHTLRSICGSDGKKSVHLREQGFSMYPSDQQKFPTAVGIAALRMTKRGILYLSRIHTGRDRILEEENVNFLCARLQKLLSGSAAQ